MGKIRYYYPTDTHRNYFLHKANVYLLKNPNASNYQIRSGIKEKLSKNYYKSLPLYIIDRIRKKRIIDEEYVVNGSLTIYDVETYQLVSNPNFNPYSKSFQNKNSANRDYNEMTKQFEYEISNLLDNSYGNLEIQKAKLSLQKIQWFGKDKKFLILKENIW